MTYALLEALLARRLEEERKQFIRAGIVASAVINFSMGHPDKRVGPEEFVPGLLREEQDLSKLPPEEQAARMMSMFSKKTYNR